MATILDLVERPRLGVVRRRRRHPLERIAALIDIDDRGCWLWRGRLNNSGYGQMTMTQAGYPMVTVTAHRACFELHNGPIPAGLVLDHLCRVRRCVSPAHLEPVTMRENIMRSPIAIAAINARKSRAAVSA